MLSKIIDAIIQERQRQHEKWGEQNHHPIEWVAILGEEFGEVAKAAVEANYNPDTSLENLQEYRDELIQVAALSIQMIQSLIRKFPELKF